MAIQVAIEGYDTLEQIGIGGMAAVYRARKVSIDKTVAIKLLFPYLATDESFIERFQREAKAAASIQHENIVNVIDFGESDGAFYIVMEYYDGCTLEQLMRERPGLPQEIALHILLEVAYGLEAAHARDIVHRDIKPANIIFTRQGGVKIADFGLARKSDSMTLITEHGKVLGTPAYMSPEQAAGRAVGPPSDIFSFGVVAYELLGRRRPFDGKTYSEVLDQIQTLDPPSLTAANPQVAPEFERIIARALAKRESERYRFAGELIADLEAAMDANQISRERRRLASYAKDPGAYEAACAGETVELNRAHGSAGATRTANTHPTDETQMMTTTPVPMRGARARHRPPVWAMAAVALVLGGGAAWIWLGWPDGGRKEPRDVDAGMAAGGRNAASVMSSAMDEAPAAPTVQLPDTTAPRVKPQTVARPDAPRRDTTTHVAETKKTSRVAPDLREKPATPAPAREPGTLSVYFLGGVGNLWVDGQLFELQPPFEKAALSAGEHRIACRMSGDESSRELTVTIEPGLETVIEYEVGGKPVVVDE